MILIISAEYEEQYVAMTNTILDILIHLSSRSIMALIQGTNGNFPCTRFLVPYDKLSDLSKIYPLQSRDNMASIYEEAQDLNKTKGNKLLQSYGLHNVDVSTQLLLCQMVLILSLIYRTYFGKFKAQIFIRHCHLIIYTITMEGMFLDHLWEEYKKIVNNLGKPTAALINERSVQIFVELAAYYGHLIAKLRVNEIP